MSKSPVNNGVSYRYTDSPMKDKVFNWVVRRYGLKGNRWRASDEFIWGYFIYDVVGYIGYLILLVGLWLLLNGMIKYQGEIHAMLFMLILIFVQLMRMNATMRKIDKNFKV